MKIERLNENQIRCTLSKEDLATRDLHISELAYGSPKAKSLFRDMMHQASDEVGFKVDDIPLMIEAIPMSKDALVLIVTKVEDPDELDTRFSHFSQLAGDHLLEGDYDIDFDEEEYVEDDSFEDEDSEEFESEFLPFSTEEDISFGDGPQNTSKGSDSSDDEDSAPVNPLDLLAPFTSALQESRREQKDSSSKKGNRRQAGLPFQLFQFKTLDDAIHFAASVAPFYQAESSLFALDYQEAGDAGSHCLVMRTSQNDSSPSTDSYRRACNIASDYGVKRSASYASLSYLKEHCQTVIEEDAISTLAELA